MGKLYYRPVRYVDSVAKTDRKLLKLVNLYPIVYDKLHPYFKFKSGQQFAWDKIARKLNYGCGMKVKCRLLYLIHEYRKKKWTLHDAIIEAMEQIFKKNRSTDFTIEVLEEIVKLQLDESTFMANFNEPPYSTTSISALDSDLDESIENMDIHNHNCEPPDTSTMLPAGTDDKLTATDEEIYLDDSIEDISIECLNCEPPDISPMSPSEELLEQIEMENINFLKYEYPL